MSATGAGNGQGAEPRYATPDDVLDAMEALPEGERRRLLRVANLCARARGLAEDGEELLSEALHRALDREGDYRWDIDGHDFLTFMHRVINTAAKALERRLYVDRKDRTKGMRYTSGTGDGPNEGKDLLDQYPSPAVDEWRTYDAKQAVERICNLFVGDETALTVIRGWFDGSTRAEIMEVLGVSVTGYETIERRIDRKIKRAGLTFSPEVDSWHKGERATSRNFQTS